MAGEAHQQRVAVGRRLGDRLGGDVAARARLVLDDHALLERRRHRHRDRTRDRVGGAARRRADQKLDRPRGVIIGVRRGDCEADAEGGGDDGKFFHGCFLPLFLWFSSGEQRSRIGKMPADRRGRDHRR